jgi:hypothetical protein
MKEITIALKIVKEKGWEKEYINVEKGRGNMKI